MLRHREPPADENHSSDEHITSSLNMLLCSDFYYFLATKNDLILLGMCVYNNIMLRDEFGVIQCMFYTSFEVFFMLSSTRDAYLLQRNFNDKRNFHYHDQFNKSIMFHNQL